MTRIASIRNGLGTIAALALWLAQPGVATAGHYEWRWQGYRSGWVYVEDESDFYHLSSPPQATRPQPAPARAYTPQVLIDQWGRTYLDGIYLGQAHRVRFNDNGQTGWAFKIPNGWDITRRDGERVTRARQ